MASIYRLGTKWRAQVRIKGKPAQSEVFDTHAEAKRWARSIEGALHKTNGEDQFVNYSEIHDEYFKSLKRCGYTKQQVCKRLLEYWKDYRLGEINTSAISQYALKRQRDGLAPGTVLTELVYMGVVLQHGGIIANNQDALRAKVSLAGAIKTLRNIGAVGDSKKRTRRPTDAELGVLRDHFLCRPRSQVPMWEMVMFAIGTCMRLGEIVGHGGVVWEDFNEKDRLLTIRARKDPEDPDGFDQTIPLLRGHAVVLGEVIDPVAIILRQQSAYRKTGRIFPFSENTVSLSFTKACKDHGIEDLHFHDLRHDGISRMFVPGGYQIPEVAAVSGHKSWKNLQRYTQINPIELHK
jgi:integrase